MKHPLGFHPQKVDSYAFSSILTCPLGGSTMVVNSPLLTTDKIGLGGLAWK